ncbi:TnsA-like heteromeric transposase endonuclease subunit [Brevibacterium picturae]|uniref:TnsA-like heteromeric transposase endonuclease subunit n=1 Tax=Brevibacterium picturae TaxID=260553 RepID=UPI003D15C6D8
MSIEHHVSMVVRDVAFRYCTVGGDEVSTTWDRARADTVVEGHPIRIPPTFRGQKNYPGIFWASTNCRLLMYESLLELDRLWLADFDPTVVGICTQPFQLTEQSDDAHRTHVPDILLTHSDQRVTLVDVKPEHFLHEPSVRDQFEWTRSLCQEKRWRYEVFSRGDATVLRNIKMLALGRRPERLPQKVAAKAQEELGKSTIRLGELLNRRPKSCDQTDWRVAVFTLMWSGEAQVDINRPLSATSVLRSSKQERT